MSSAINITMNKVCEGGDFLCLLFIIAYKHPPSHVEFEVISTSGLTILMKLKAIMQLLINHLQAKQIILLNLLHTLHIIFIPANCTYNKFLSCSFNRALKMWSFNVRNCTIIVRFSILYNYYSGCDYMIS